MSDRPEDFVRGELDGLSPKWVTGADSDPPPKRPNGKSKPAIGGAGNPMAQMPIIRSEAELAAMVLPPAKFVVDRLIPIGLTVLSAPPKIGKTWMVGGCGRAVATGGAFCGSMPVRQGKVLVLDLEGNPRRAQNRLKMIRGESIASHDLSYAHEWPPMGSGGLELVEEVISRENYILVIIDVWARFRPPRPRNADPYQHDYETAKAVQELAHRLGAAIVLVHHNRKAADEDWTAEIGGSVGLTAAADTLLTIKRERGKAEAVLKATGRDIEDQELALAFSEGRWSILGDAVEHRMNETRRAIYDCLDLADKPMTPSEVAELTGLKRETVKKTLQRMLSDGVVRCDSGKYWPARR